MNTHASYQTREELLILAQQHGYTVSPTQLARWHRAGLLPRPQQQPLKGTRGTCSLYPTGTSEQLLFLCSLHTTERSLAHLAWQLWLAGYPVALHRIRTQLDQAAERLGHWMQWFSAFKQAIQAQLPSEDALDLMERSVHADFRSQPLRQIRKRIGRELFPTFLRILVELAMELNDEPISTYDEQERLLDLRILALGLGLEKRFVQKNDALEYYLVQSLMPQLRWLFARLQEVCWGQLLSNMANFDILQARDDLRSGLRWKVGNTKGQDRLPKDYPRWRINLHEIFSSLPPTDQALVFVCWSALWSSCASYGFDAHFLWSF